MRARSVAVVLVVLLAGLTACTGDDDRDRARTAGSAFLADWAAGNYGGAADRTDAGTVADGWLTDLQRRLGATKVALAPGKTTLGDDDTTATQRFRVAWTLPGFESRPWRYDSSLTLRRTGEAWRVRWTPALVHPALGPATTLSATRKLPPRAAVLDRAGQPLFGPTEVVTVGIVPQQVPDLEGLAATLGRELDVTPADVVAAARRAKPDELVPVITLRKAAYEAVRPRIYGLPGTKFRTGTRLLGPSSTFAQPYLGRVGEATREVLTENKGVYTAGDTLGTSGLQRAFNRQLAGVPGLTVALTDQAGTPVRTLWQAPPTAPRPLRLTLDRAVQTAADRALADVSQYAAIVAVRPSTGEVLAVADSASAPFDVALAGQYPPGSTFKIVTAAALLENGVAQPTSTVPCPATTTVGGKTFRNAGSFALGPAVPLRRAFARSCNTTFTTLGVRLPADALRRTAAEFGVGAAWKAPVTTYSGAVPPGGEEVDRAAASIGQGRVLVSPLSMTLVAATLQRGTVPTPVFVAGTPATAATPPPSPPTGATLSAVRDFARAVVTEGTAPELRSVPGGPVSGKTGTAEYGDATPPRAHSWFVGYRGDLAFAVFVHDGDSAGRKATPIARTFLSAVR